MWEKKKKKKELPESGAYLYVITYRRDGHKSRRRLPSAWCAPPRPPPKVRFIVPAGYLFSPTIIICKSRPLGGSNETRTRFVLHSLQHAYVTSGAKNTPRGRTVFFFPKGHVGFLDDFRFRSRFSRAGVIAKSRVTHFFSRSPLDASNGPRRRLCARKSRRMFSTDCTRKTKSGRTIRC